MAAYPNPSNALGVQQYLKKRGIDTPVVNVPGCPANPEWATSVLVDVLLVGQLPELTNENKPKVIFNQTVHDNCQRRGHFENGEFVYAFGTPEEAMGYCLYPMGCRGPQTKANCGIVRWNRRRSWCVESGGPCIGCCVATRTTQARTGSRPTHRSVHASAICASAALCSSLKLSLGPSRASSLLLSLSMASA